MKENPRVLELDTSSVERIEFGTVECVHILAMMLGRASDWGVAGKCRQRSATPKSEGWKSKFSLESIHARDLSSVHVWVQ